MVCFLFNLYINISLCCLQASIFFEIFSLLLFFISISFNHKFLDFLDFFYSEYIFFLNFNEFKL